MSHSLLEIQSFSNASWSYSLEEIQRDLEFIHIDDMIIVALLIQIPTGFALNLLRQWLSTPLSLVADEQKPLEASFSLETRRVQPCQNEYFPCQPREAK